MGGDYEGRLSVCFSAPDGKEDVVTVAFYNTEGLIATKEVTVSPGRAVIFDTDEFRRDGAAVEFGWFIATCERPDLAAYSFHYHKESGNASGEHSF